jgi:hypothetical protein
MSPERQKIYTIHPDGRRVRVIENEIVSETEDCYIIWSDEFHMTALPKTGTHWGFTEKEALERSHSAAGAVSGDERKSKSGVPNDVYELLREKNSLGQFSWDELVKMANNGALLPTDFLTMGGSFMGHQAKNIKALWSRVPGHLPPHLNERDITHPARLENVLNAVNIVKYLQCRGVPHEVLGQDSSIRVNYRGKVFDIVTKFVMPSFEMQVEIIREFECSNCGSSDFHQLCNDISRTHRNVKAYVNNGKLVLVVEMLCRNMRHFEFAFKRAAKEMHGVLNRFE